MGSDSDLNSTQAAAVVALFLVLLIPIAVALAWWFKQRYARAVVQLQASTGGATVGAAPLATVPAPRTTAPPLLSMRLLPAASIRADQPDPVAAPRQLRRRVLRAQFVFGLIYWFGLLLLATIALLIFEEMGGALGSADAPGQAPSVSAWATVAFVLPVVLIPPLLAWALQAGVRPAVVWWIVVGGGLAMGMGLALMGGQEPYAIVVMPVVMALLGLMMSAFLRPAVRGAGTPLMAAMIMGFLVFSALATIAVLVDDTPEDQVWTHWTQVVRDLLLMAGGIAISALVGWRVLLRIARRYGQKRFSELQLALGTYWGLMTLFTLASILFLSFEPKTGGRMEWIALAGVLWWLAWRVTQRLALRWAVRRAEPPRAALLLLRVFKPSRRSEAFIDRFLARWRFAAPVWMIAGPDLAGALMEPDEFFAFLRRKLGERYVSDAAQIPQHVAALDNARDPDGRCRVSEMFCANSTWQPAVLALIERAGVIVLDLREYTESRAGTRYELQQLLSRAPLERVLLLTDEAGDAPRLRAAVQGAWQAAGSRADQSVTIVQLAAESDRELDGLFRLVAGAAH